MSTQSSVKSPRTKCEVYTRVMGYLRPVSHYNTWKKSEFYSRKYFTEKASRNSIFVQKYSSMPLGSLSE